MVDILSPMLVAHSSIRHNASGVQTNDLDWSVRAPIGIVINRITLQAALNDVSGAAAGEAEMIHGISLDPNETDFNAVLTFTPLADLIDINSDFIALQHGQFDGAASASGGAAGMQHSPIVQHDWVGYPPESRPITFRPLRHMFVLNVSIEWQVLATIEYQLARFADNEVAAFSATRP